MSDSISPHATLCAIVAAFLIALVFWGMAEAAFPSEWDGGYYGMRRSTVAGQYERTPECDGDESGFRICKACADFEK